MGGSDSVHWLRNGRILRLSLFGRIPNWDSRLTAYDASMIFLDRNGRMVVPAVDGVRVLAQLAYPLPVN